MDNYLDYNRNCLPDDCLQIILNKLQNNTDRNAFGLVCRQWLHIQNISQKSLYFHSTYHPDFSKKLAFYLPKLLARFPYINYISLAGCTKLTNSSLNPLSIYGSNVKSLSLSCCLFITDIGLAQVTIGCPNLETLTLDWCNITDVGLRNLASSCHALRNVSLANCTRVSDRGLGALCSGCPNIQTLIISHCQDITGICFEKTPNTLTHLEADSCMLSGKGMSKVIRGGKLKYLTLSNPMNFHMIHKLGCIGLGYGKNLRFLNLRMCVILTDESIKSIAKGCPLLEEWNLAGCSGIHLVGWSSIGVNCKKLRVLNVNHCDNLCDRALGALGRGCVELGVLYLCLSHHVTVAGLETFKIFRPTAVVKREDCVSFRTCIRDMFV